MRLFYLPIVDFDTSHVGTWLRNTKGMLCILVSFWLKLLPLQYSLGASLRSHRVIHIKAHIKGFHNKLITQLHLPYQRGLIGLAYNGDNKLMMTFLRFDMMFFQPINLKSIIPLLWRIPLRFTTSTFLTLPVSSKFSHKRYS